MYRRNKLKGLVTMSHGGGQAYQKMASSVGLVGNDRHLVHFYALLNDNQHISRANIYNEKGDLASTLDLNETELELYQENGLIKLIPLHMDSQNTICIADYTRGRGFPIVKAVKLTAE